MLGFKYSLLSVLHTNLMYGRYIHMLEIKYYCWVFVCLQTELHSHVGYLSIDYCWNLHYQRCYIISNLYISILILHKNKEVSIKWFTISSQYQFNEQHISYSKQNWKFFYLKLVEQEINFTVRIKLGKLSPKNVQYL